MKPALLCCVIVLASGIVPLAAQTATPAQPVDPGQGRPAQPVAPATPATAAPASVQVSMAVLADSSLRQVLVELAQSWADSQDTAPQVPLTVTNAGTIRAKVDAGSTWDLVIDADLDDVKEMTQKGLLLAEGQRSLARNTLVLYGRKALIKDEELEWFDLIGTEWKKVAMGNPDLVESGRVAQRALQKHDLLDEDHKKMLVMKPSESLALGVVQAEQADAVFVYKTDLVGVDLPGFAMVPLKTEDAPPIFYTVAICRLAKNPALAKAFIEYCGSDAAKAIWAKYGFETN